MTITRRFFGLCAAAMLFGCSARTPIVGAKRMSPREQIRQAIESHQKDTPIALDPILISLLVSFVISLFKQCLLQNVLQKKRMINRRPDGIVAKKMAEQLRSGFLSQHPDADQVAVESHVESALQAFRESTNEEIVRLYQDAQNEPRDPTEDEWNAAAVAKSINALSE